jgi:hypothetical protein
MPSAKRSPRRFLGLQGMAEVAECGGEVMPGDTIAGIARQFVAQARDIRDSIVHAGSGLVLPGSASILPSREYAQVCEAPSVVSAGPWPGGSCSGSRRARSCSRSCFF